MKISEILFGDRKKSIAKIINKGDLEELNNYIKNDGNVNDICEEESLLHFAIDNCYNNYFEVIEFLINNGADVNSSESYSKGIPLHRACARIKPRMDVIKLLLEKGSKVNSENTSGKTPIFYCNCNFSIELLNLLIKYGADIKHIDKYGNTILHDDYVMCGDKYEFEEYLKTILSYDIDINWKNNLGNTPLDLCKDKYISNILFDYIKKNKN